MKILKERTSTRSSATLAVRLAIVFAIIGCTLAQAVSAADDDYIFCYAKDRDEKVTYFSTIFFGDYLYDSISAKNGFYRHLKSAGIDVYSFSIRCKYENSYDLANLELEKEALEPQRYPALYSGWTSVRTNWKPGFSGPLPPRDRNDPNGRDNGGDGCYFGECPDNVTVCLVHDPVLGESYCEMDDEMPVGRYCECLGSYDRTITGVTGRL